MEVVRFGREFVGSWETYCTVGQDHYPITVLPVNNVQLSIPDLPYLTLRCKRGTVLSCYFNITYPHLYGFSLSSATSR